MPCASTVGPWDSLGISTVSSQGATAACTLALIHPTKPEDLELGDSMLGRGVATAARPPPLLDFHMSAAGTQATDISFSFPPPPFLLPQP